MEQREERWFVHFRGHSLGPITATQLKSSIKQGELKLEDKIASAKDGHWRPIAQVPDFAHFLLNIERPKIQLKPLPPAAKVLRKRGRKPKPVASASEKKTESNLVRTKNPSPDNPLQKMALSSDVQANKKTKDNRISKSNASLPTSRPNFEEILEPSTSEITKIVSNQISEAMKPHTETNETIAIQVPSQKRSKSNLSATPLDISQNNDLFEILKEWRKTEEDLRINSAQNNARQLELNIPKIPENPFPKTEEEPFRNKDIKLELNLSINKLAFFLGLFLLTTLLVIFSVNVWNKSRGPKSLRSLDPSSPTSSTAKENDPFSLLKPPTRPQRD